MYIVMDLKGMGDEMKNRFLDHARSVIGGNKSKLKSKLNGISQVIVSSLVDSFEKLDELENQVGKVSPQELFNYEFKMTKHEWIAALSITLLILILYIVETGNGFAI
jgi:energy-coupling factor transport system permease protein